MNSETQTGNGTGISWLGGGQPKPGKSSGNTGLASQLPIAAFGHILVPHLTRWLAHMVAYNLQGQKVAKRFHLP